MKKRILSVILALGLLLTPVSALTVEQAREILDTYYIDQIPEDVLALPAIDEILDALGDPYTQYYSAEEYAAFLASMEDTELVGIGIQAYYLEQGVLLDQVAPDSPASEAGLLPGDWIVAIDGRDTRGAASGDVDGWIRGEEGTRVELTVLREDEPFTVTLTRRPVVFPTVILEKIENQVGWISCSTFGSTTFQQFCDIITAHDSEVQGWVVDLRGNGGGDLLAAVFSAGCFAGWGEGAYLRDRDGRYHAYLSEPELIASTSYYDGDLSALLQGGYLTMSPVYVLTDGETASAAEFFCAVIRDAGAGLIIGERTYGKGVAQSLFSAEYAPEGMEDYFRDGDALKLTAQRGYAGMGATCDKVGILPHFLVDAGLADEAAALLAAPVAKGEDAMYFLHVSAVSQLVGNMVLPLHMLCDPAYADAAAQLFSALPAGAICWLRVDGELTLMTPEEAARACGVTWVGSALSDLAQSDFADEIKTLERYGIVSGCGDGTFRPEATLDRASLCVLLVKALRLPLSEGGTAFADVAADAWYAPYVNVLYEMGLINGCGDGLFHPGSPVTHEQLLTVLGRAARWLSMDYDELARHDGIYGDQLPGAEELAELYPGYAAWTREMVWLCGDGLLWDAPDRITAAAPASREEAAAAVYNLLRAVNVLPA